MSDPTPERVVDWLGDSPDWQAVEDGSVVTVDCTVANGTVTIIASPTHECLVLHLRGEVTLQLAEDVDLPDGFLLRIVADEPHNRGDERMCRIRGSVPLIECSAALPDDGYRRPAVEIQNAADISVTAGNWAICPQDSDDIDLSLHVRNDTEQLRIVTGIPVSRLDTCGNHELDLSARSGGQIVIHQGTVTFQQVLRVVHISGDGHVTALGGIAASVVNTRGDLVANGSIHSCEIDVTGKVVAARVTVLEDSQLKCSELRVSRALENNGTIRCSSMQVDAAIRGTGAIEAASLVCLADIDQGALRVSRDLRVTGELSSTTVICGGRVELSRGAPATESFEWSPESDREEFHVRGQMGLLQIAEGKQRGAHPRLVVVDGTYISNLQIGVPSLQVAVEARDEATKSSGQKDTLAILGVSFERSDCQVHLVTGSINCNMRSQLSSFSLRLDKETLWRVAELDVDLNRVSVAGEGRFEVEAKGRPVRLGQVSIIGPISFHTAVHIDKLDLTPGGAGSESRASDTARLPTLHLEHDIEISYARGACVLSRVCGRIHGDERNGLAIAAIETTSGADPAHSQLVNVDISKLTADAVTYLKDLQVLEISGRSIRRYARERTWLRSTLSRISPWARFLPQLSRSQIKERGEIAMTLASYVADKVNSGKSRTSLAWSISRLQHRGLDRRSSEKPFRAVYRLVGYGYRPLPALMTWTGVALAALIYGASGGFTSDYEITDWLSWIWRYIEILLQPVGYLRLGSAGGERMFMPNAIDLLSRLLIGLPFLFSILSIRQYFRSPVGQRTNPERL